MTDPAQTFQPLTEAELAARFLEADSTSFRYCEELDAWFGWTGTHWQANPAALLQHSLQHTLRKARAQAISADVALLNRAETRAGSENILALARQQAKRVTPEQMDADPLLLNCANGTLDLRTSRLRPHNPDDLITRVVGTAWEDDSFCAHWEVFLLRVCAGDTELVRYLQRCMGYTLTGDVREQVVFMLWGDGANGKSTFLLTLLRLLGTYAKPADLTLVTRASGDDERLFRKRLVVLPETPEGQHLNEARLKALTGGDVVVTRDGRSFAPTHKLWMGTNQLPEIRGTEHAMWRRLCPIPFRVRFEERDQNKDLLRELSCELPGILRWAAEGCEAWRREGLNPPDTIRLAAERYRVEQDRVGVFIAECCELGRNRYVLAHVLYEKYVEWAMRNGETVLKIGPFGKRLAQMGFERLKMNKGSHRGWLGVDLPPLRSDECRPMAYEVTPAEETERKMNPALELVWKRLGGRPGDPSPHA